jgi:hypothetical protein
VHLTYNGVRVRVRKFPSSDGFKESEFLGLVLKGQNKRIGVRESELGLGLVLKQFG